ncbi:PAS domain S-box protein [Nonomuraea sp. NPDC050663]|uniref:PAS domain S-box protein n=1 Tax=Nonomuraea sp. NPDC050663 TaxID=3364370 RepID=UPI00378E9032
MSAHSRRPAEPYLSTTATPGSSGAGGAWLPPAAHRVAHARRLALAAALGAAALAVLALAGWVTGALVLTSLVAGQATMKPDTAVGLGLLAAGLLAAVSRRGGRRTRIAGLAGASAATVIGVLAFLRYLTGAELLADDLWRDRAAALGDWAPAVMAPNVAVAMALTGVALLLLLRRRPGWARTAQAFGLVVMMSGLARLVGLAYRVPELERFGPYSGMALPAALCLLLLGAGTFLARPTEGWTGLLAGSGGTALIGRWLLGTAVIVPPILGWVRLTGQDLGWFDPRLGLGLLVAGDVSAFLIVGLAVLGIAARIEGERARAQHTVRELVWLRTLMDHTPAAIYMKDLAGRFLAVNATFARMIGRAPEQMIGLTAHDLLPRATADRLREHDLRAQSGGRAIQADTVLPLDDGVHEFLTTLVPLADSAGTAYGVCGIATDVTERAAEQRERDRLQRRFADLLEAAPDAMVIVDGHGMITFVNAQTETLFEYSRDELIGAPVEMLLPAEIRDTHRRHRRSYTSHPRMRPMGAGRPLRGRRKDGSAFPVEISLSPLETDSGVLISAAIRDITTRERAEQRLAELAAMVESSQDAIFAQTPNGIVTFWNAAATRLFGYTSDEIIGWPWTRLVPSDRLEEAKSLLTRLRAGERIDNVETVRLAKGGRPVEVELTFWPLLDDEGAVTGIVASCRDISARKHQQAALHQLYEQQRHIALTLQRSLMTQPPDLPGLATARRYVPATGGAGVGGDWYDLIALEGGRYGVLIADVMGRGLEAAAVMGHLRSAAHALAKTGMEPERLMAALDDLTCDLPERLVTCCYLVIDPEAGKLTACSAGHPPALLAAPGEPARRLDLPVNTPLGLGQGGYRQAVVGYPRDALLALYTDGLIEIPRVDLDARIDLLAGHLRADGGGLEEEAERLLSALLPDPAAHDDDVTLLLLTLPAGSSPPE